MAAGRAAVAAAQAVTPAAPLPWRQRRLGAAAQRSWALELQVKRTYFR